MENTGFDIEKLKKKVLRKYPAFGSVIANCEYQIVDKAHPIQTAGTDGKIIYMNKDYLRTLEEDEQVFVLSHEICHIGLNHILRSKDKDPRLWNIATDAVINRHLVKDGLPKLDNMVYLEDALNYDAEELYNKLLQDKQNNSEQSGNNQQQNQNNQNCNCQNPGSCGSQNGQQGGQNTNGQGNSQSPEQDSKEGNQGQSGQQSQNDINSNDNNQNQNDNSSQNGQNGNEQNSKGQKANNQKENSQSQNKDTQGGNQEQQNNQGANSQGGSQSQDNNNSQVNDYQVGHDEHTMWADALKDYEQNQGNNSKKDSDKDKDKGQNNKSLKDKLKDKLQKGKNDKNTNLDNQENENQNKNIDDQNQNKQGSGKEGVQQYNSEKEFFKKNNEMKIKYAEEVMNKLSSESRGFSGGGEYVTFKDIGDANKPVVNWKKILKETLEVEDEEWGHRFSDKGNNYAARIQDVEYDEMPDTEIILDVSGSVSEELLRNFLRQVKTVLKKSHIKVGTFDYDFHGFTEIKNAKDIDNLIFYVGGGTNFDAASRAFTKRRDVNKICFTDGEDGGDAEIIDKRSDIIWITFKNPYFKPDYGKVIYVPESVFYEMKTTDNDYSR